MGAVFLQCLQPFLFLLEVVLQIIYLLLVLLILAHLIRHFRLNFLLQFFFVLVLRLLIEVVYHLADPVRDVGLCSELGLRGEGPAGTLLIIIATRFGNVVNIIVEITPHPRLLGAFQIRSPNEWRSDLFHTHLIASSRNLGATSVSADIRNLDSLVWLPGLI